MAHVIIEPTVPATTYSADTRGLAKVYDSCLQKNCRDEFKFKFEVALI